MQEDKEERTDVTESHYSGAEGFDATEDGEEIFTYLNNDNETIISSFRMPDHELNERVFPFFSNMHIVKELSYHPYNKQIYAILQEWSSRHTSFISKLTGDAIKFPFAINHIFFTSLCTVIFHSQTTAILYLGWASFLAKMSKEVKVTEYVNVLQYNNNFLLFIAAANGNRIEHWILGEQCRALEKVKTYYLHPEEQFSFDGKTVARIYLDYAIFVSWDHSIGYLLNVLDITSSQNDFLYASVPISEYSEDNVNESALLCLRTNGRNIIMLLCKNSYHYFLLELDPYVMVQNPSSQLHNVTIMAYSSAGDTIPVTLPYTSKPCIKMPHPTAQQARVFSNVGSIYLPLSVYIYGYGITYDAKVLGGIASSNIVSTLEQHILIFDRQVVDDRITAIYRCDAKVICAFRPGAQRKNPIYKFLIENDTVSWELVPRMTTLESMHDIYQIVPTQFKEISAFIICGKSKSKRVYQYSIALTAAKMYELTAIQTDVKAQYIAIDNNFNNLLMYSRKSYEVMAFSITNRHATKTHLPIPLNCSVRDSPSQVLLCPTHPEFFVASELCGLQIFKTNTDPYAFNQSFNIAALAQANPNDPEFYVQGLYGCDQQLYVVLAKHGILKFVHNNSEWVFDGIIPNYNNALLTSYGAFDGNVMAIVTRNESSQFVRIYDLAMPTSAMLKFDLPVNASEPCTQLVLHSVPDRDLCHLFYLCGETLYRALFTLNPILNLTVTEPHNFTMIVRAYGYLDVTSRLFVTITTSAQSPTQWLLSILLYLGLLSSSALLFYCWTRETRVRTGYRNLLKELRDYEKNKQIKEEIKKSAGPHESALDPSDAGIHIPHSDSYSEHSHIAIPLATHFHYIVNIIKEHMGEADELRLML